MGGQNNKPISFFINLLQIQISRQIKWILSQTNKLYIILEKLSEIVPQTVTYQRISLTRP